MLTVGKFTSRIVGNYRELLVFQDPTLEKIMGKGSCISGNFENLKQKVSRFTILTKCCCSDLLEANSLFPVSLIKQVYSSSRYPDIPQITLRKRGKISRSSVPCGALRSSIVYFLRSRTLNYPETGFHYLLGAVSHCEYLFRKRNWVIWNCVKRTGSRTRYFVPV